MNRHGHCFFLIGVLLLLKPTSSATSIEFQGHVDYKHFDGNQRVQNSNQNWFRLVVDQENAWNLEFHSTFAKDGHFVSTGQSNEIYRIQFTKRHRDSAGAAASEFEYETGVHPATVAEGVYPVDLFPAEKLIWLTFASKAYRSAFSTNRMSAIWLNERTDVAAYAFEGVVDPPVAEASYPERIVFQTAPLAKKAYEDILQLQVPTTDSFMTARNKMLDAISNLPRGQFAAMVKVDEVQTFKDLQVPTRFSLEVYYSAYGAASLSNVVVERFLGAVTNMVESRTFVTKPRIIGTLSVTDHRFQHRDAKLALDSIRYKITNQTWLAKSDPFLTQTYATVLPNSQRYKLYKRPLFLAFLLFNASVVAFIIMKIHRQKIRQP